MLLWTAFGGGDPGGHMTVPVGSAEQLRWRVAQRLLWAMGLLRASLKFQRMAVLGVGPLNARNHATQHAHS